MDRQKNGNRKHAIGTVLPFLIAVGFFSLTGCSHALHITNLNDYYSEPSAPLKEPLRIGVTSGSPQNGRYVSAVVEALKKNSNVAQVVYPYKQSEQKESVDAVADIAINPKYSGRGSNFFVNWPGFLIFAPAIWGYGYNAEINTAVNVTKLKDNYGKSISIPCTYNFRHAEMTRTWTEIGWLEIGIIPLIGGIVFTNYDEEATDDFINEVSPYYGSYVAGKIISALRNDGSVESQDSKK